MSDTTKMNGAAKLDRSGIGRIIQVLVTLLIFGALLFLLAGRFNWVEAWVFLGLYLIAVMINGLWSIRHNPEVINERGRIGQNAKGWDKVIGVIYTLLLVAIMVVAGLDARNHWSLVSLTFKIMGGLGFCLAMALTFWAMKANTFLTTFVRIQVERGHYTVTTGPYRFVRHPMYSGVLLMGWAMPLMLGSWWALIPGLLIMVLFVIRTSLEDRTLQAELPGYVEYIQHVHYRLIPGVW